MEPFPSFSERALKRLKRISADRSCSPQVPTLPVYVAPEMAPSVTVAGTQPRRSAASSVVVRNDESHIFLRSRYKKLYEDLEKSRKSKSTPSKRVTISEHLSNGAKRAMTPKKQEEEERNVKPKL